MQHNYSTYIHTTNWMGEWRVRARDVYDYNVVYYKIYDYYYCVAFGVRRSRSIRARIFPNIIIYCILLGCHCLSSILRSMHESNQSNTCSSEPECVCVARSRLFLFVYCLASRSLFDGFYSTEIRNLFPDLRAHSTQSPPSIGACTTRRKKRRNFMPDSAWHIYVYFNCNHRRNCNNKGKHYPNEYLFERTVRFGAIIHIHTHTQTQLLIQ